MYKVARVLWVLVLLSVISCGEKKNKTPVEQGNFEQALPTGNTAHLTGKQLAQAYCQSCHLFPDPLLLDKQTWKKGVLPNMALRLGLDLDGTNPYASMPFEDIQLIIQADVFASKPLITQSDWEKIVTYYETEAPEKPLPQQSVLPVKENLPLFTPKPLRINKQQIPLTTLLKFDKNAGRIFLGDRRNNLYILDKESNVLDSLKLDSPASDITINRDGSFNVLTMGILNPSDSHKGRLIHYTRKPDGKYQSKVLLDSLNRPVAAAYADLNQDGLQDIVVCNHGNHTGKLVWYQNKGSKGYKENILKLVPGARNVVIRDFNRDGRLDIMALIAQASESIIIFFNKGEGQFTEKEVLRFPPVYGSSYVEVADFNADGAPDILYTNGDNADYSISFKNYHGIRLFLNNGRNNFKQAWFYPMFGASKAVARDFDQDGDLDIAAIAFFPDFEKQPRNGFVYLQNNGKLPFSPSTFQEAGSGRWLVLDTGDLDRDGNQDILLGSFTSAPDKVSPDLQKKWYLSGPDVLILNNNLKANKTNPLF